MELFKIAAVIVVIAIIMVIYKKRDFFSPAIGRMKKMLPALPRLLSFLFWIGIAMGVVVLAWKGISNNLLYLSAAALLLAAWLAGFFTVPVSHEGIILLLGKTTKAKLGEGWHWLFWPFMGLKTVSLAEKVTEISDLTVFCKNGESEIRVKASVRWKINNSLKNLRVEEKSSVQGLTDLTQEAIRKYLANKTKQEIIGVHEDLAEKVKEEVENKISGDQDDQGWGIEIIQVFIKDLDVVEEESEDKEGEKKK